MKPPTVLIVVPDRKARGWLRTLLRAEGFRVLSVSGGLEALALCACRAVDLVLVELELVRVSAEALVATLRDRFPALPIVGLCGDPARPRPAGLADVLPKPLDPAALAACVRRTLACAPRKQPGIETPARSKQAGAGGC